MFQVPIIIVFRFPSRLCSELASIIARWRTKERCSGRSVSPQHEHKSADEKLHLAAEDEKGKEDGSSDLLEKEEVLSNDEERIPVPRIHQSNSSSRQRDPGTDELLPEKTQPVTSSSFVEREATMTGHILPFHAFSSVEDIQWYLEDLERIPALSLAEEREIIRRIAAEPRSEEVKDARRRLIEGNLRLVVRLARRYQPFGLPLLDLIQEGNLALVSAVHRFDPGRGQHFRVFATRTVFLALRHMVEVHLRERHLLEMDPVAISPLSAQTFKALMRNDLDEEAAVFDLPEERLSSLDALLAEMDRDDRLHDNMLTSRHYNKIENATQGSEDSMAAQERSMVVAACLQSLSHREREVVLLRFGCFGQSYPRTLEEVGRILRLSPERVRQIEERAIRKLRHPSCSRRLREVL
jgi:RNA polymerase primary sigma factor